MLRIITLNLNGIRSAWNKGLLPWLEQQQPDIVCLQEIKAQLSDLNAEMQAPDGMHACYHCAEKKATAVSVYGAGNDLIVSSKGLAIPSSMLKVGLSVPISVSCRSFHSTCHPVPVRQNGRMPSFVSWPCSFP